MIQYLRCILIKEEKYMSKKIRFIDPKRTKELQESMKDHGRASTYWGLIILVFFIVAFILSYYFEIR